MLGRIFRGSAISQKISPISGRGWRHLLDVAVISALLNDRELVGETEFAEALYLTGHL
jgi:hypothetical protein